MRGKIPVTERQFFDSVDTWIWRLTEFGEPRGCGFCKEHILYRPATEVELEIYYDLKELNRKGK